MVTLPKIKKRLLSDQNCLFFSFPIRISFYFGTVWRFIGKGSRNAKTGPKSNIRNRKKERNQKRFFFLGFPRFHYLKPQYPKSLKKNLYRLPFRFSFYFAREKSRAPFEKKSFSTKRQKKINISPYCREISNNFLKKNVFLTIIKLKKKNRAETMRDYM